MTGPPEEQNSSPKPFLHGFFRRAPLWWTTGLLISTALPTLLFFTTPVEFQSTLRITAVSTSPSAFQAGSFSSRSRAARGELLAALSSIEMMQRVQRARHNTAPKSSPQSAARSERPLSPTKQELAEPTEPLTTNGWTALLESRYRVAAGVSDAIHVLVRGTDSKAVTSLGQQIANTAVAVFEERQHQQQQRELSQLAESLEKLRPSLATLRAQSIVRYDHLITDLAQQLERLDRSKGTASEKETKRRQLDIAFRAAVLQKTELDSGLPMGQETSPGRLLGADGDRYQELERRHSQVAIRLADPSPNWDITTDLQAPTTQLPRALAFPMVLAFFLPLTLVAAARLLIELPLAPSTP